MSIARIDGGWECDGCGLLSEGEVLRGHWCRNTSNERGFGDTVIALLTEEERSALAGQPVRYDGVLAGLERGTGVDGCWAFEGCGYDTPADEAQVLEAVGEALEEPDREQVAAAAGFVFKRGTFQYTSQALLAMLVAYETECEGGDGVHAVAGILREAARRIAVVEALTV